MYRLKKIWNKNELLMNTIYESERDALVIVTKDINTGEKKMYSIDNPSVPAYFTIDENPPEYREMMEKDKLEMKYIPWKFRPWKLANELGIGKVFTRRVREKKMHPRDIYLNRRLYGADLDIKDAVMRDYVKYFTDKENYMTKVPIIDSFHIGGLDIETDIRDTDDMDDQPVIVNTYVDGKDWHVYSICLINENYKGQKEIIEDIESFYKEIDKTLQDHINKIDLGDDEASKAKANDIKKMLLPKIKEMKYSIKFTTDEKEVIMGVNHHIFKEVNPDYLLIYNAQFDINQQIRRMRKLEPNFDSATMFKGNDGIKDNGYAYINTNNQKTDLKKRFHIFDVRNKTKILDQMLLYYQMRRQFTYSRHNLDTTANREVGVGKLDYSKHCNYIGDFPYVAYKEFLIYNIIDILSMIFIDMITRDTYGITYRRFGMCSEWDSVLKSMPSTTNIFELYYELQGYIPGCDINGLLIDQKMETIKKMEKTYPGLLNIVSQLKTVAKYSGPDAKDKDKNPYRIEGGFVSDPNMIDDSIKDKSLYKIPIKTYSKFGHTGDDDAKAMYPSNDQVNNGSKSTLIGRLTKVGDYDSEDIGRRVALALINQNYANIGKYFFNLPSANDIIKEYYNINPVRLDSKDDFFSDIKILEFPDQKSKGYNFIKAIYSMYQTNFDVNDVKAGFPSVNKLWFLSDENKIKFSYYSTKVEIETEISTNEMAGIEGNGFLCGFPSKGAIKNYNEEYRLKITPRKEVFKTKLVEEDVLDENMIDDIINATILITSIKFKNGYKLDVLGRQIYIQKSPFIKNAKYQVYDIEEDDNLFKVIFSYYYERFGYKAKISQSIIGYKF